LDTPEPLIVGKLYLNSDHVGVMGVAGLSGHGPQGTFAVYGKAQTRCPLEINTPYLWEPLHDGLDSHCEVVFEDATPILFPDHGEPFNCYSEFAALVRRLPDPGQA
jgi:hypothetical protein